MQKQCVFSFMTLVAIVVCCHGDDTIVPGAVRDPENMDDYKEKLIEMVRARPLLWDPRVHDYMNTNQRTQVWDDSKEVLTAYEACFVDMDDDTNCRRHLYTAASTHNPDKCEVSEIAGDYKCYLTRSQDDCDISLIDIHYGKFGFCNIS